MRTALRFKLACEQHELDQVYDLNYRTFVEEIPQHQPNPERRLVDARLEHSTLYVCLDGDRVVGMVAVSDRRPFSLDRKLPDLDSHLPAGDWRLCEVRLLSIEPAYRRRRDVLAGLLRLVYEQARVEGYDIAVISAATNQLALYRRIGFRPFGPPLGTVEAPYQGMQVAFGEVNRLIGRLPLADVRGDPA